MASHPPERSALEQLRALQAGGASPTAARSAPPSPITARRGLIGGAIVLLGLAWKLKAVLVGIKLGSFLTTGSTMLLMAWTYSLFYGWRFAAGFVVLILVHELGHGAATVALGLRVGAPVFIPFFGAFIALRERPRSTFQDFVIGAGGPIAGSAGGAACVAISFAFPEPASGLFRALGFFTLVLNMFNLIPVWQLDGARMIAPIRALPGIIGFSLLLVLLLAASSVAGQMNPIALFIVALGGFRVVNRWRQERRTRPPARALDQLAAMTAAAQAVPDEHVTRSQRAIAWSVYFGLAAVLLVSVHVLPALLPDVSR